MEDMIGARVKVISHTHPWHGHVGTIAEKKTYPHNGAAGFIVTLDHGHRFYAEAEDLKFNIEE